MGDLGNDKKDLMMQLSPNVRRAWNHRVTEEMKMKPRIIFDYELLYLEKGKLIFTIEDTQHILLPGEMVLFKPGKEHEFLTSEGESWMPHIHFDALYHEDFDQVPINFRLLKDCTTEEISSIRPDVIGEGLNIPDVIRIENHGEVFKTLMQLIYAYDRRDSDFYILQKTLVLRILLHILKGLDLQKNSILMLHQKALENSVSYIMEHYNETVKLEDLAKVACLSIYHFSRLFKQKYGISTHQFQIYYRIERSKEFMIYNSLSLTSIAEKVGYSSVYSFSKIFKQVEGVSPSQYMKFRGI